MDHVKAHQLIMDIVRPVSEPIGLALIPKSEPWPAEVLRPAEHGLKVATCQWTNLARREGLVVGLRAEDMACAPSLVAFGLKVLSDPSTFGAFLHGMGYLPDPSIAADLLADTRLLEAGAFQGLIASPLRLAPREPDAVWIYGSPAQMNHLVIGLVHEQGRPPRALAGLGLACRQGFTDQPTLINPGRGERVIGCTAEHEMLLALPYDALGDLVRGLEATAAKGITAPVVGPPPVCMPVPEPMLAMVESLVDP